MGCEVGLFFYERAERATITILCYTHSIYFLTYIFISLNFLVIHILYISLHIFPVISKFSQRYWYTRCTVLRRTVTLCVKQLITCKLCSVSNSIKASGSSGWCKYFYVPTCQSIGLRRTFRHCSLAALARKTIA